MIVSAVGVLCGITHASSIGSVHDAADRCVNVNLRSLLTGDPPPGESHGVIDVRDVLVQLARCAAPRGSGMCLYTVSLLPLLASLLLSQLLFGEAME